MAEHEAYMNSIKLRVDQNPCISCIRKYQESTHDTSVRTVMISTVAIRNTSEQSECMEVKINNSVHHSTIIYDSLSLWVTKLDKRWLWDC